MSKSGKGSSFEREICKKLSLWWSDGQREDIFWRTSGSGARAKTRSKKGQSTFGQAGDIQATDPIGQPLIDVCTIELKRGYSRSTFADLADKPKGAKPQLYEEFIEQAATDCLNAGSFSWMLITKRDRREALVFVPPKLCYHLFETGRIDPCKLDAAASISVFDKYDNCYKPVSIYNLDYFLENIFTPEVVRMLHKQIQKRKE